MNDKRYPNQKVNLSLFADDIISLKLETIQMSINNRVAKRTDYSNNRILLLSKIKGTD